MKTNKSIIVILILIKLPLAYAIEPTPLKDILDIIAASKVNHDSAFVTGSQDKTFKDYKIAPNDLNEMENVFSAVDKIDMALTQVSKYPIGTQISFLMHESLNITTYSQVESEILLKETLIRARIIVKSTINHLGANPGASALHLVNYLVNDDKGVFYLARAYGVNARVYATHSSPAANYNSQGLKIINSASYGIKFARNLFEHTQGITGPEGKAIMFLSLIHFLQWDLTQDLRVRNNGILKSLKILVSIKKSLEYEEITNDLKARKALDYQTLALLRDQIANAMPLIVKWLE